MEPPSKPSMVEDLLQFKPRDKVVIKGGGPDLGAFEEHRRRALERLGEPEALDSIIELCMVDTGIDEATCLNVLCPLIRDSRALTRLDISHNPSITGAGAKALGEAVSRNVLLRQVDLSYCRVGDEGFTPIARAVGVHDSSYSGLECIRAMRCGITDDAGALLGKSMAGNDRLKVVYLNGNLLSDATALALGHALLHPEPPWPLHTLSLANNQVGPQGVEALAQALATPHCQLQTLYLGGNKLGDAGALCLAQGLVANTSLASLNLTGCGIRCEGAKALASVLAHNSTLVHLSLAKNSIGEGGMDGLARGLEVNHGLRHLDLGNNTFTWVGMKFLSTSLRRNDTLVSLKLHDNNVGDQGAITLAEGLERNHALTQLDLSRCQIGPDGAKALAHAISRSDNITLRHCGFGGNLVSRQEEDLLAAALTRPPMPVEDYEESMVQRSAAHSRTREEKDRLEWVREELVEKAKASLQGGRNYSEHDRQARALFEHEARLLAPDQVVMIPVCYGREPNVVGRLAAKTSTTLEMARRLIQPMLVKGEHDYSFISQDGVIIPREEEATRCVFWDCGAKILLRPDGWIDLC